MVPLELIGAICSPTVGGWGVKKSLTRTDPENPQNEDNLKNEVDLRNENYIKMKTTVIFQNEDDLKNENKFKNEENLTKI